MMHPFDHKSIGEILCEKHGLSANTLSGFLDKKGEKLLGQVLLEEKMITPEQLAQALAEQSNHPYVSLKHFVIPPELLQYLPVKYAYRYNAIPYEKIGQNLHIAVSDPYNLALVDNLERISGLFVQILISSAQSIDAVLKRSEGSYDALKGVSEEFKLVMVVESEEGDEKTVSIVDDNEAESPVIKLINSILHAAIQKRASDVHIEIYESGITVKYRIDGVLYPATDILDRKHHSALISRLKVMAELDIAEKRIPQDGRFKLRLTGRDIDFRVSILPSYYGEDVVIRVLDRSSIAGGVKDLKLSSLNLPEKEFQRLRKNIHEPYGMVLITGPTGSGKTTTLYAALNELTAGEEKIITIEDPVEYQLDGVVQIPVNEKKGLTFFKGLRSILRHDPDKIMVGEIRDGETAQIAVQSALTGHLVFTTVHANNAVDVIGRFANMGVDIYNLVTALNCVMAQRLVRVICPHCITPVVVNDALLTLSGLDPEQYNSYPWHEGKGCEKCSNTGYLGRTTIVELLTMSPKLRECILARKPLDKLLSIAKETGMRTLRESAIEKVLAGETTLKEINRVTFVE